MCTSSSRSPLSPPFLLAVSWHCILLAGGLMGQALSRLYWIFLSGIE